MFYFWTAQRTSAESAKVTWNISYARVHASEVKLTISLGVYMSHVLHTSTLSGTFIKHPYISCHTFFITSIAYFPAIIINIVNCVLLSRLFALSTPRLQYWNATKQNQVPATDITFHSKNRDFRWAWSLALSLALFSLKHSQCEIQCQMLDNFHFNLINCISIVHHASRKTGKENIIRKDNSNDVLQWNRNVSNRCHLHFYFYPFIVYQSAGLTLQQCAWQMIECKDERKDKTCPLYGSLQGTILNRKFKY